MPAPDPKDLGPLAALIGTWEGTEGVDVSFHNDKDAVAETLYTEKVTMNPFGPVVNGEQSVYGLDYRMAAYKDGEDEPFHTEIGYWLWDAADQQVMRCFLVPRSTMVLAGGTCTADATSFKMTAERGSLTHGLLESIYFSQNASTSSYTVDITVHDENSWSYDQTTAVDLRKHESGFAHTDRNTLRRVS